MRKRYVVESSIYTAEEIEQIRKYESKFSGPQFPELEAIPGEKHVTMEEMPIGTSVDLMCMICGAPISAVLKGVEKNRDGTQRNQYYEEAHKSCDCPSVTIGHTVKYIDEYD